MRILFFLIIIFSSCYAEKNPVKPLPADQEIKIIFATDLHYIDSSLLEPDSLLHRALRTGDGKMTHYSPEIVNAFLDEVIRIKPCALVLTGDLTFNGEKKSHVELAKKLQNVKNAGIPVLAIPGNHDINSPGAYRYLKTSIVSMPNVAKKEFRALYSPLCAANTISSDKNSLSYVYKISEDVCFMMLDTCQYERGRVKSGGKIGNKTLAWMEENLKEAQKSGITVISAMHHNLLLHSSMFRSGFTINNYTQVAEIMDRYGVPLNLSGHMHIQHIKRSGEETGIYDIAMNSLTVFPNFFGTLVIGSDKSIYFKANKVNVAEWAENSGVNDENLLQFDKYSYSFMNRTILFRMSERLANVNLEGEQKSAMIEFAQMLNTNYFSGIPSARNENNEKTYDLWKAHFPHFFTRYFDSILKDSTQSTELHISGTGSR